MTTMTTTESPDPLSFAKLRSTNVPRWVEIFEPLESWSETDWATAVAGEVGELCSLINRRRRGEHIPDFRLADEIADTIIYLDLLSARLDIDMGAAVRRKFNEVSCERGVEPYLSLSSESRTEGSMDPGLRTISVSLLKDRQPFIYAINGCFTLDSLASIEKQILSRVNEYLVRGEGSYHFSVGVFLGLSQGWELEEVACVRCGTGVDP